MLGAGLASAIACGGQVDVRLVGVGGQRRFPVVRLRIEQLFTGPSARRNWSERCCTERTLGFGRSQRGETFFGQAGFFACLVGSPLG